MPRALWWLIAPFELSIAAPLLHDFLYRHRGNPPAGSVDPPRVYTRAEVDRLFRKIMEQEGVATWRRVLGYAAVRLFGGRRLAQLTSGPGREPTTLQTGMFSPPR